MTTHIIFKCYICKHRFYTKQALSLFNNHLTCSDCIKKAPKKVNLFFNVVYRTARLEKTVLVKFDTEAEAREYVLKTKKFKAVSIVSVTRCTWDEYSRSFKEATASEEVAEPAPTPKAPAPKKPTPAPAAPRQVKPVVVRRFKICVMTGKGKKATVNEAFPVLELTSDLHSTWTKYSRFNAEDDYIHACESKNLNLYTGETFAEAPISNIKIVEIK